MGVMFEVFLGIDEPSKRTGRAWQSSQNPDVCRRANGRLKQNKRHFSSMKITQQGGKNDRFW
jgi:hypothetical protein